MRAAKSMKHGWLACLAAGAWSLAVPAQQPMFHTPVLMGAEATPVQDQRQDDRVGHLPLAREDRTLQVGRELRQGEAVVQSGPPPRPASESPRVRAQTLLLEDRARVKREAALDD